MPPIDWKVLFQSTAIGMSPMVVVIWLIITQDYPPYFVVLLVLATSQLVTRPLAIKSYEYLLERKNNGER